MNEEIAALLPDIAPRRNWEATLDTVIEVFGTLVTANGFEKFLTLPADRQLVTF